MRTFRAPASSYAVASVFVAGPLAFLAVLIGPLISGNFKMTINGSPTTDPSAAIFPVVALLIFLGIGIVVLMGAHFTRAEVDAEGIRIYNLWNRRQFASSWDQIEQLSYERESRESYNGIWNLKSNGTKGRILKSFHPYADLMRIIATSIPAEAKPAIARPEPSDQAHKVAEFSYKGGTGYEKYGVFFGVIWVGFGLFFVGGWVTSAIENPSGLAPLLLPVILLMLGAPTPLFLKMYRAVFHRIARVGPDGIKVDDGRENAWIRWDEIVFAETRSFSSDHWSYRELVVVSPSASLVIDSRTPIYDEAVRAVTALAPDTALATIWLPPR